VGGGRGGTPALRALASALRSGEAVPLRLPTGEQGVMEAADYDAAAARARESLEAGPRRESLWALDLFLAEARRRPGEAVPVSVLRGALLERERGARDLGEGAGAGRAAKRPRLAPSQEGVEACLGACVGSGLAVRTGRGAEESLVATVPGAGLLARSLQEGTRALESMLGCVRRGTRAPPPAAPTPAPSRAPRPAPPHRPHPPRTPVDVRAGSASSGRSWSPS